MVSTKFRTFKCYKCLWGKCKK